MGARHPPALRLRQGEHAAARGTTAQFRCGPAREVRWRRCPVVHAPYDVDAMEHEAPRRWRSASRSPTPVAESSAAAVIGEVESGVDLSRMMQDLPAIEDLLEAEQRRADHPNAQRAADAGGQGRRERHPHRTPRAQQPVRFRVDGTLREVVQPNKALHAALISRLKIMAELDIAEKRLPQDGRIRCASAAARWTCASRRCRRRTASVRAAPARQGRVQVHARGPGHERRHLVRFDKLAAAAARHRARDRAHRLGQDDDAVRACSAASTPARRPTC